MNIQQVKNYTPYQKIGQKSPQMSAALRLKNKLITDVVTFGQSRYHSNRYNSYPIRINLAEIKRRLNCQLEKEAAYKHDYEQQEQRKITLLRKKFISKEIRRAFLNNRIPEKLQNKIVTKLLPYPQLLSELFLEPDGGGLLLNISNKNMHQICAKLDKCEYFAKIALTKDTNGQGFIDKASAAKIKIFNKYAKKYPELLEVLYTTQRSRKRLPAHFLPPAALNNMCEVLKKNPDLLKKILTSTDVYGNTPAHNRFAYGQAVIAHALEKQIPTAEIVYTKQNKFGEYFDDAYNKAEKYKGPYEKTWNYIFNNF